MESSLRARKKLATHDAILAAAIQLCSRKGYAKTTLSDIAAAANVSQRTIFSYYPAKEAIILEPYRQKFASIFSHLESRGDMSVFDALRSLKDGETKSSRDQTCQRLVETTPELREHLASLLSDFEHKLVEVIAAERGLPLNSIQAYLIAAACRALVTYSMDNDGEPNDAGDIALRFIEAGLEATA